MNITSLYPSKYLKSDDLKGHRVRAVIEDVVVEEMADGSSKPVLRFQGRQKGMVLNKTNANVLAAAFGPETSAWHGREVELFSQMVSFKGTTTPGLRLAVVQPVEVSGDDDLPDF